METPDHPAQILSLLGYPGGSQFMRLLAQEHFVYVISISVGEDFEHSQVERFDLNRLASDGIVFSGFSFRPLPFIASDGQWLLGIDSELVRVDPEEWTTTIVPEAWADPRGALAAAGDGRFLSAGRVGRGPHSDLSIALRHEITGAVRVEVRWPPDPLGLTGFELWPIAVQESGDP